MKRWLSRWPLALIAFSSLLMLVSARFAFGAADWAGLGQWVGGLGAFAAAWVALVIANREVRRDRAKEAARVRAHAYYVKAKITFTTGGRGPGIEVINSGSDPVLNVRLMTIHRANPSLPDMNLLPRNYECPVLVPREPWTFPLTGSGAGGSFVTNELPKAEDSVEIVYDDLAGTRWHRIGSRPPQIFHGASRPTKPL